MKNIQTVLFFCVAVFLTASSCQKAYERPDIILSGTNPSTGGGGTTGSGLLTKLELKTSSATSTYTYAYNSSNQLTGSTWTTVSGGQTTIYEWTFTRDNTGKCLQINQKINNSAFPPAGILYTTHYSSASAVNFDYMTAAYDLGGASVKDSIVFTITNGKVGRYIQYTNYVNSGYQMGTNVQYLYDNSGNVITTNYFADPGTGTQQVIETTTNDFDAKTNPLQLGQEAIFIDGETMFSKNNITKAVTTSYASSPTGTKSTVVYVFQYNSDNKPVSAVVTDPSSGNSGTITYTYQ